MTEPTELIFDQAATAIFHFIRYDLSHDTLVFSAEEDEASSQIFLDYDYEAVTETHWKIYIDVTLVVPKVAKMITRAFFETDAKDEIIFQKEVFAVPVGCAIKTCIEAFNEQCEERGIDHTPLAEDIYDYTVPELAQNFCEEYFELRRPNDIFNLPATIPGILMTSEPITHLNAVCTFLVLDEIMFTNPNFNNQHNQDEISKVVPVTLYQTLKLQALEILKGDVEYNLKNYSLLLILMDIAMQMLVGDHYEYLLPALRKANITDDAIAAYLRNGSGMIADLKKSLTDIGSEVGNLEISYDWNSLVS